MGKPGVYNPKMVTMSLGNHLADGFADDSFITIEQVGDGNTHVVGVSGEVMVSVDPSNVYSIKIVVLQNSKTNKFLDTQYEKLKAGYDAFFTVNIKDLLGNDKFTGNNGWVVKKPSIGYAKAAANREWELAVAEGNFEFN